MIRRLQTRAAAPLFLLLLAACGTPPPADRVRVSGQVEATDVEVAALVGGRILEVLVREGERVEADAVIVRLDVRDAELALARATAERDQASAQLRLVRAGARPEDIRQAEAQHATARAEAAAADADTSAAQRDVERFEQLLAVNSGTRKQRDDAVARRDVARERARAAHDRVNAAAEQVARLRSGARREEIEAAAARLAATEAHLATLQKAIADATITAPLGGIVTARVVEPGELAQPRMPLVVITDLDHAWANVYVDEPLVPRLRLGQPATLFTDAGGAGIEGRISHIASTAEFTPRNVQTAEDRSKLVYRVKVSVDNRDGVLKSGMPVEAEIAFER